MVVTPERRLLLIASLSRLLPAALIVGSEDVWTWDAWGQAISTGTATRLMHSLGWPPLWLPFTLLAYNAAEVTHLPFHLVVKAIPSAVDVIITFVLYAAARDYGLSPFRTALCYALNPISIYVSAVHGNFDAIPALCTLMAVLAAGNANRAGAWLGVGAGFKTWPLFALPAIRRVSAAVIAVALFVGALMFSALFSDWRTVFHALRYRGLDGWWGVSSIPTLYGRSISPGAMTAIFYGAMAAATLLLLIARAPAPRGTVLMLLTFLMTTPGFGVQYLIWIVPVALLADQRRAVAYSMLGGCLLAWEVLARPFTGFLGDTVRLLPHHGFAGAYGGANDHLYTVVGRLVPWAFVCYWWLVTLAAIVRARRDGSSGPSYTNAV